MRRPVYTRKRPGRPWILLFLWLWTEGCDRAGQTGGWAVQAGGPDHPAFGGDVGTDLAVNREGFLYVTGAVTGSGVFGPGLANAVEIRADSYLGKTTFLARYRADGALDWAVRTAGTGRADSARVAALPDGGALVGGQCQGPARLGSGAGRAIALDCDRENNLFLARYRADGAAAWAVRIGGAGEMTVSGILSLEDGSALVAGLFSAPMAFPSGETGQTVLAPSRVGVPGLYLARYDPDGALVWARRSAGFEPIQPEGAAWTANRTILVTGSFTDRAALGPAMAVQSAGGRDLFVAAFDETGAPRWVIRYGGPGDEQGTAVGASADGRFAVLGQDAKGSFVNRYEANGRFIRSFRVPGTALDLGVSGSGDLALTGRFLGDAVFGQGQAHETTLFAAGDRWREDAFTALYGADDRLKWAARGGGPDYIADFHGTVAIGDSGVAVAIDPLRKAVYATGYFYGQATFDLQGGQTTILSSTGGLDLFLARLAL